MEKPNLLESEFLEDSGLLRALVDQTKLWSRPVNVLGTRFTGSNVFQGEIWS